MGGAREGLVYPRLGGGMEVHVHKIDLQRDLDK